MRDYYFCGINLKDERLTDAICRIGLWANQGFCYEMSGLCMLVAIDSGIDSAKLKIVKTKDNHWLGWVNHCFVEFSVEGHLCVVDPSWTNHPHIAPKQMYLETMGGPVEEIYSIDAVELEIRQPQLIKELIECIKAPETSFILSELGNFRPNVDAFGRVQLDDYLKGTPIVYPDTGKTFRPVYQNNKKIDKEVFIDFIKNPALGLPKKMQVK